LNSARPGGWYLDWSRGRVSAGQLIRLRKKYRQAPADALRILVVHHPPAAPPQGTRRHLIDKRPALFGALNEAGVDLVLSGHFHMSYAVGMQLPGAYPRQCVLSVTSTATSHRLKGEPNGFHVIEGDRSALRIAARNWDGTAYTEAHSWTFHREGREGQGDWSERLPGRARGSGSGSSSAAATTTSGHAHAHADNEGLANAAASPSGRPSKKERRQRSR
jgi:hypothetical protein